MSATAPAYVPDDPAWLAAPMRAHIRTAADAVLAVVNEHPTLSHSDRLAALAWALGGEIAVQSGSLLGRQNAYEAACQWAARVCNEYVREMDAAVAAGRQ